MKMNGILGSGVGSALLVPAAWAAGQACREWSTRGFRQSVDLKSRSFPIVLKESARMILLGRIIAIVIFLAGPACYFLLPPDVPNHHASTDWTLPVMGMVFGIGLWLLVWRESRQSIVLNEDSFTFNKSPKHSVTVRVSEITNFRASQGFLSIKREGHSKRFVISLEIWQDSACLRELLTRWQSENIQRRIKSEDQRCVVPGFGFPQDG
jgi:hypothetical protein